MIDPKKIAVLYGLCGPTKIAPDDPMEWRRATQVDAQMALAALPALLAEREELIRERDEQASFAATLGEVAKANAERARLGDEMLATERVELAAARELLRECADPRPTTRVEGPGTVTFRGCALCAGMMGDHAPDCRLAALLRQG